MATKTYQEWFDDVGRKMMCDDAYDRTTYGQALWKAATDAAVEEFTSTNNESMPCKIGVYGDLCRLGYPCKCKHGCLIKRTAYVL